MALSDTYKIIEGASKTFKERNELYGDNYDKIGKILETLFPDGIHLKKSKDFERFHIFSHIISKTTRYANNFFKGGHQDSIHDLGVYSFILENTDCDIKKLLMETEKESENNE